MSGHSSICGLPESASSLLTVFLRQNLLSLPRLPTSACLGRQPLKTKKFWALKGSISRKVTSFDDGSLRSSLIWSNSHLNQYSQPNKGEDLKPNLGLRTKSARELRRLGNHVWVLFQTLGWLTMRVVCCCASRSRAILCGVLLQLQRECLLNPGGVNISTAGSESVELSA